MANSITLIFNRVVPSLNELLHKKQGFTNRKTGVRFYPYTKLKKEWNKLACDTWLTLANRRGFDAPVEISIIIWKKGKKYDTANLIGAVDKLIIDGLVEGGVLIDDDPDWLQWGTVVQEDLILKRNERMEITIRQVSN